MTTPPVAVVGYAPCGHAVFAGLTAHEHTEAEIKKGRQQGRRYVYLAELPERGVLAEGCLRCRKKLEE